MEFTKEEIELAKKVFESYQIDQRNEPSYTYFLDSLLRKVTELPEVFSREQVIDIFDNSFTSKDYIDGLIDRWLSERNK